jgi:hypothetical protein
MRPAWLPQERPQFAGDRILALNRALLSEILAAGNASCRVSVEDCRLHGRDAAVRDDEVPRPGSSTRELPDWKSLGAELDLGGREPASEWASG